MTDIYLYACSTDSLKYHPQNNPNKFIIELPEIVNFNSNWANNWSIAVTDIYVQDEIFHPFYIYCDICEQSIYKGELKSLLKVIYPDCVQFGNLHYITVKSGSIKRIEIYIKGGESGNDNILTKPVYLTLHLTNKL